MGIDPSGRWLVAAGQLSSRLTVYAIDPASGRLRAVHSHATGADPICIEIMALPDA
jgi:6-phosphogluconolactonase